MALVMVRFAELGLKSEKVRKRFLYQLADDIEESLIRNGIENLMEVHRSRIFIDLDDTGGAVKVLKQVPGIYSFSFVEPTSSDRRTLMKHLKDYGKERLREGMTYGLKVKRTGRTDYTSQEIAAEGGGAVMSHLPEGSVKVDLGDPDIWFEVEIRDSRAYLFIERIKGMGGMPASSQGNVVLLLPSDATGDMKKLADRALLSHTLMRRRGCRVITVVNGPGAPMWQRLLSGHPFDIIGEPEVLHPEKKEGLSSALEKHDAHGLVLPFSIDHIGKRAILPDRPVVELHPTVAMCDDEVEDWLNVLFK